MLKSLVAVFEQLIAPLVVLVLVDLVLLAELGDLDLAGESFEHDLELLGALPLALFLVGSLREPILT